MDFSDRFKIYNIDQTTINTISDVQLNTNYPDLATAIQSVKRHSVLLTKKSNLEIYLAITEHADPKIGLILAAARDNSGNQLFGSTEIVKQFMFGTDTNETQISDVTFRDHQVFIDGIKRVSIALAASLLIGQLAQIPEQLRHAEYLEKEALKDLDRILQVPTLQAVKESKSQEELTYKSFYFQPLTFTTPTTLQVEVFLTGLNRWELVNTYLTSTQLSTATIASDIADTINRITISSSSSNLIASVVLAGDNDLHQIDFRTRQRDLVVYTDLVSIKFTDTLTNSQTLAFNWGIKPTLLKPYLVNSLLLAVESTRVSSLPTANENDDTILNTLYFRQIPDAPIESNTLEYRISPTMTESIELEIEDLPDTDRANIAATALLNSLFELKESNKVLGSIIQNDPTSTPQPSQVYSGIYLVSYTATKKITEFILDVLTIPSDLEVAVGTRYYPITSFSTKPRSITVKAYYQSIFSPLDDAVGKSLIVKAKPASITQRMADIKEAQYKSYTPRQYYPLPPEVYDPHAFPSNQPRL
jgi:hypothetical protein